MQARMQRVQHARARKKERERSTGGSGSPRPGRTHSGGSSSSQSSAGSPIPMDAPAPGRVARALLCFCSLQDDATRARTDPPVTPLPFSLRSGRRRTESFVDNSFQKNTAAVNIQRISAYPSQRFNGPTLAHNNRREPVPRVRTHAHCRPATHARADDGGSLMGHAAGAPPRRPRASCAASVRTTEAVRQQRRGFDGR